MQKLQLIMPPAAKIHIFLYFQAAKRKIMFFQDCLKPMPKDASRREIQKSVPRIEKGALCAAV